MNVGTSGITSTSPGTLTYEWYRVDHEEMSSSSRTKAATPTPPK